MAEAVAAAEAALTFLASAEVAGLPGEQLAEAARGLARAESVYVAARSRVLASFTAQDASVADGQPTTKSWLRCQTRATSGAAAAAVGWMRRLAAHPRVAAALAAADLSPSWAAQVCKWTDKLPEHVRDDADAILLGAADGGADLADLSGLAREIHERTARPAPDDGPPGEDESFRDRWLRLDVTFGGTGRIEGALTPECTAGLLGMLDSLGKKSGPEDDRSQGQRHHDALEEAMRLLLGTGDLPDVAGQPAQVLVHATLGQLIGLADAGSGADSHGASWPGAGWPDAAGPDADGRDDGGRDDGGIARPDGATGAGSGLAGVPDAFLSGQAAGDGEPGWLASAAAAQACACDAKIATIVTGHVDPAAVAAAVRDWLDRLDSPAFTTGSGTTGPPAAGPGTTGPPAGLTIPAGVAGIGPDIGLGGGDRTDAAGAATGLPGAGLSGATSARLAATLTRYATAMLSGPAGLASALRAGLPGPLGTAVSLPLDITSPTATVPPHLRRAVIARDRHCAFPGCWQRPVRCQVHHLIPRSRGGPTRLTNLILVCDFHHLTLIHRRGWALTLNADGTTTATSPDGRKVLHSHPPPDTAAA